MKKRLLSALLALALVFVLLPTTALAKVVTSNEDISIAGIGWKFESDSEVGYFYNGNFTTDEPNGSYLKLTKSSDTITVTVYGNVTVSNIKVHKDFVDIGEKINLIIAGNNKRSTLTLNCTGTHGAALETYQSGDITIKDGITVNANFSADNTDKFTDCYGIRASKNLIITGKGTTVNAVNADDAAAVKVDGNITVSDDAQLKATNKYSKKVTNYTGNAYAIECGGLSISGNNTKVTAKTSKGEKAISGTVYNLTENDDYKLTFKAGMYEGAPSFDYPKPMDKALGYMYVEITQAPTDPYVFIAGEPAIMGQETPIPGGSGTYLYVDAGYDGNILTLKDATINKTSNNDTNAIKFTDAGTYTVNLEGTNKISNVSTGISAASADQYVRNINITITGAGSLEVSTTSYAIAMNKGNLKFENTGEIKLTTSNPSKTHNVLSVSGNITITDMDKYSVTGITQTGNPNVTGDTVTLSEASQLKGGTTGYRIITITPAAAKPSTISYGGKTLTQGQIINGENGGTATVAAKGNTITLNNFNGTQALSFEATLADSTLVLEGTNTLSSIVTKKMGLTISGSGSLTAGSIKVTNNDNIRADLTITDGAAVIAKSNEKRAIDIDGDLTVTNGSLTATSNSNNVPTVQVGGNASFTGSTVTITNHSTTQGERYKDSNAASSALHVNGAVTISGGTVTAEAKAGGNAIRAVGNITVSDGAQVTATNNSQHFSAITAGQASGGVVNNLSKLIVSGETTKITATNSYANSSTGAIHAKIKNANEGHYLQVGTGTDTKAIAPNAEDNNTGRGSITITRGDAYETPQVTANYTIAGQTMYVGKYYKTDANGNITDGTAQDYNIYCDSENDFTLNNATISSTGTGGSTGVIKTNLDYSSAQFHIKLIGTNSINNAGHHAILGEGAYSTIIIENAENASNASLTISGNFLPVYSFGNVTINAEVVIINTNGNLISTNKDGHAGAFDLDSGYKCYASTSVSGSPLETYDAAKSSTYKYLRVTKENLAPTTPTPQTPFTIYGIPAQFVDGGMIATTGVTATSSNNINLPIDRVKWYTFTPVFGSDGRMDSVSDKTEATGNFEADKYYVVEIKFVQDLSPFKSWDMKVSGWSDNDVYRQSVTARNDIEIYFLTPASAATHEHNWAENYDTVYHWKMCTYDGCTAIKDKALHVWNAWHTSNNEQQHWKSCSECSYSTPPHDIDLAYVSDGEQGHHLYCKHDGCTFVTGTTAHNYEEGSNICTDCGYNKSAPCDHTGDHAYTNNGDGTHKVTCKACGATIVEKQNHEFNPTGVCIYCGATQSGGDPTPDNPGTIVIIRPAEEEKPAQQPNPSTGANDLVGLAVAAAVAAALGSAALLRKHD